MHLEDLIDFLQKLVWLIGFELNRSRDIMGRDIKKNSESTKEYGNPVLFNVDLLTMVA